MKPGGSKLSLLVETSKTTGGRLGRAHQTGRTNCKGHQKESPERGGQGCRGEGEGRKKDRGLGQEKGPRRPGRERRSKDVMEILKEDM